MSPLWSILHDFLSSGEDARDIHFFYGARTEKDLFYIDKFAAITAEYPRFKFIPVLSNADEDTEWQGETGFVHQVVGTHLKRLDLGDDLDVYACGPTPMIDALTPVLFMNDVDTDRIYYDRFTPAPA